MRPERVLARVVVVGLRAARLALPRRLEPLLDAVLGDAGVGVITQGFLDDYIANWGVDRNFPTDLPGVSMPVQSLSLVDLVDAAASRWDRVRQIVERLRGCCKKSNNTGIKPD